MNTKSLLFSLILLISATLIAGNTSRISEPVSFGYKDLNQPKTLELSIDHTELFEYEYDDGLPRLRLTYYSIGTREGLRIQALHPCTLETVEMYIMGPGTLEVHIWDVDSVRMPNSTELITPIRVVMDSSFYGSWEEIILPEPVYLPAYGECLVGRELLQNTGPVLYLTDMEDIEGRSYLYDVGTRRWNQPTYSDSLGNRWVVTYLVRATGHYYNVPDEYCFLAEDSIITSGLGVALCDYDNDGDADFMAGTNLYRNDLGEFNLVSGTGISAGGYPYWGDFDMDGNPDVYFASGVNEDKLYANSGSGVTFHDVTAPSGDIDNPYMTDAATWIDYDKDGDMDLYIVNSVFFDVMDTTYTYYPDQLYRNDGAYFIDATDAAGMGIVSSAPSPGKAVAMGDWNNDGNMDLYVSNTNYFPNYLWRNTGTGTFEESAYFYGVDGFNEGGSVYGASSGACFGDIDNDCDLDLLVANQATQWGSMDADWSMLYINEGSPFYYMMDEFDTRGLENNPHYSLPTFVDFDNDGWLDIFITCFFPGAYGRLFKNDGTGYFEDYTEITGINSNYCNGAGWADIELDGDMDLIINENGCVRIYTNTYDLVSGTSNGWVHFRCEGTDGNRMGIGTRLKLFADGHWQIREIGGLYGATGSQSDFSAHFGLGSSHIIDTLVVRWNSGTVESLYNLSGDTTYHLIEGAAPGVDEKKIRPENIQLGLYPNPFNGAMSIRTNSGAEIEIYDIRGNRVFKQNKSSSREQAMIWQPEDLSSGLYLIKANYGGKSILKRAFYIK